MTPTRLPSPEAVQAELQRLGLLERPRPARVAQQARPRKAPNPPKQSREQRWKADLLAFAYGDATALARLQQLQQEYRDWYAVLPAVYQQSGNGQRLYALATASLDLTTPAALTQLQQLPHPASLREPLFAPNNSPV